MDRDQILITPELIYVDDKRGKWYDSYTRNEPIYVVPDNTITRQAETTVIPTETSARFIGSSNANYYTDGITREEHTNKGVFYNKLDIDFYLLFTLCIIVIIFTLHIFKLYGKLAKLKAKVKKIKHKD